MVNHVNLLRTGVGVENVAHLHEIQNSYRTCTTDGGEKACFFYTRNTPLRANDILNGGSVYWIIKRQICVRQPILDVQTLLDEEGKKFCHIIMDPNLTLTSPIAHKHIQGWRYLTNEKAPSDIRPYDPAQESDLNDIDPQMAAELAEIGLL